MHIDFLFFVILEYLLNAFKKGIYGSYYCIPEHFNTKILHQLFDYKITFVNSQRKNTNPKSDLFVLIISDWYDEFNQ